MANQVNTIEDRDEDIGYLMSFMGTSVDTSTTLKRNREMLDEYIKSRRNNKGDDKNSNTEELENSIELVKHLVLNNSKSTMVYESFGKNNFGVYAVDMVDRLVAQYGCSRIDEITLCQTIATAFTRYMQLQNKLAHFPLSTRFSQLDLNYYNSLERQASRFHKQYLEGLKTLKVLKQPPLKVNIKAENAYLADKQQVNNAK